MKAPFVEHGGGKLVNSGPYNGLGVDDAIDGDGGARDREGIWAA